MHASGRPICHTTGHLGCADLWTTGFLHRTYDARCRRARRRSSLVVMSELEALGTGPFTTACARRRGINRGRLASLVDDGLVRQVIRGVYVVATTPDSLALRAAAVVLAAPDHVVVADRCAAWLHGVDVLDFTELDMLPALEVVSWGGNERTRRHGVLGGERALLEFEITMVDRVRVTTPIRTACDIACLYGRYRAIAVLDAFRRQYGITIEQLLRMLPRYARRRGVKQLRELIPLTTDQADSQPESWVRLMIHDDGLPMPAAQVWVHIPGWGTVRIENAYEHLRIAVEYDGEEHHTTDEDRAHDEARRAALRQMGWIIIVVRKHELAAAPREVWLRELRDAIADRAPEGPVKRRYARGADEASYRRRPVGARW